MKAPHHRGTYHRESRALVAVAYQNPYQRCWRCHLTLPEIQARYPRRRVHWTAGHLTDGQPGGPLAAECSPCNYGAGARLGNQQRRTNRTDRTRSLRTSRTW